MHPVASDCPLNEPQNELGSLSYSSDQHRESLEPYKVAGVLASQPYIRRNPSHTRQPPAKFIMSHLLPVI